MKTMSSRVLRSTLSGLLALGALAAVTPAATLDAQEARVRADCTCVDRDGKEIENCRCLRTPDVDGVLARVVSLQGRARIGITLSSEQDDAESRGARVESVLKDGPADRAGIREGDVITSLDGHRLLASLEDEAERDFDLDRSIPVQRLMAIARDLEPGQEVAVEYIRDGETFSTVLEARDLSSWGNLSFVSPGWDVEVMADRMKDLGERMRELRVVGPEGGNRLHVWADSSEAPHVRLRALPEGRAYAFGPGADWTTSAWPCPGDDRSRRGFFTFTEECIGGLELVDLRPGLADYFGTSTGVLVADVHEDSKLGLEPGDVVLAVDGRETTSPAQLRRILGSYEADEDITLQVMRHQRETQVVGRLGR
jgi:hypothetical protein